MTPTLIRNQKGQSTVEMVLLLVLTLGVAMLVSQYLKKSQFAQKLAGQPWSRLSGMIECGVWSGCGPTGGKHPNTMERVVSYRPDQ